MTMTDTQAGGGRGRGLEAELGLPPGLRDHLVATRLAGDVATVPPETVANCGKFVAGHDEYTFGLDDWRSTTLLEAVNAVRALCGGDPGGSTDPDALGWIDPDAALTAIARHRDALAELSAGGGGKVLLATGHPTGLLGHYAAIARALQATGSELLAPLDDTWHAQDPDGRPLGIRFVDGVACVFDGGSLRHSHRSVFMEAMLDALDGVDLVVGDHGMAGTAISHGIPTLSIADVNDPALPVAQVSGRTDAVLPIDDNLAPRLFVPVTEAMLAWF